MVAETEQSRACCDLGGMSLLGAGCWPRRWLLGGRTEVSSQEHVLFLSVHVLNQPSSLHRGRKWPDFINTETATDF